MDKTVGAGEFAKAERRQGGIFKYFSSLAECAPLSNLDYRAQRRGLEI